MTPYLIAVVGSSGSGKTSLIERLAPLLTKRGLKVGIVKHAHDRIDLDRPGKDSWRCLKAGAEAAAVVGPKQILVMKKNRAAEDELAQALKSLPAELDLILLEGFHTACVPQIAVADGAGRIRKGCCVVAVVSDHPFDRTQGRPIRQSLPPTRSGAQGGLVCRPVRRFRVQQIKEIVAFIDQEWTKQWESSCRAPFQALSSVEA